MLQRHRDLSTFLSSQSTNTHFSSTVHFYQAAFDKRQSCSLLVCVGFREAVGEKSLFLPPAKVIRPEDRFSQVCACSWEKGVKGVPLTSGPRSFPNGKGCWGYSLSCHWSYPKFCPRSRQSLDRGTPAPRKDQDRDTPCNRTRTGVPPKEMNSLHFWADHHIRTSYFQNATLPLLLVTVTKFKCPSIQTNCVVRILCNLMSPLSKNYHLIQYRKIF